MTRRMCTPNGQSVNRQREKVVLAEVLQVLTEGNVEATPFRKKNFSAQGDYEVVSCSEG